MNGNLNDFNRGTYAGIAAGAGGVLIPNPTGDGIPTIVVPPISPLVENLARRTGLAPATIASQLTNTLNHALVDGTPHASEFVSAVPPPTQAASSGFGFVGLAVAAAAGALLFSLVRGR